MKKPLGTLRQAIVVLLIVLALAVCVICFEGWLGPIELWHLGAVVLGYFVLYLGVEYIGVGRGYLVDDIESPSTWTDGK